MTRRETNILKGIAIILMYMHHLFYSNDGLPYPIIWSDLEMPLVVNLSRFGKVCVEIFVFVNAYGLTKQYEKKKIFQNKIVVKDAIGRYKKLLLNFWCIYVLFFLVSLFSESHTWWNRYGEDGVLPAIKYFVIDILGLAELFGTPTFNSTWWYLSLAIVLFIVVPLINRLYDEIGALCIPATIIISAIAYSPNNIGEYLLRYLFGVALGVVLARENSFERWRSFGQKRPAVFVGSSFGLIIVLMASVYLRNNGLITPRTIDNVVAVLLALLVLIVFDWKWTGVVGNILESFGKHSMNMFLSHTFIKAYYFEEFTYSFGYWWLILIVLLADTWLISVIIESIKEKYVKWIVSK